MTPPWRLLLADDDALVLEVTGLLLELEGHAVVTAKTGEEALARAAETPVDAVVIDILMPGMGGLEVARRLREGPGGREMVIIALSGRAQAELNLASFDGFVLKPAKEDQVIAAIQQAIQRRSGG